MAKPTQHKHKPLPLDPISAIGGSVVAGMDTVAGIAGTTLGAIPAMPIMIGTAAIGTLNQFFTPEGATPKSKIGKVLSKTEQVAQATFGHAGEALGVNRPLARGTDAVISASAPLLNTASHIPGLKGLHSSNLKQIPATVAQTPIAHGLMMTQWIGGSVLGAYGAGREFSSQIYALRKMEADMRGVEVEDVSTANVLMGAVSKPVAHARDKTLKICGSHSLAAAAGLVMALKAGTIDQYLGKFMGKLGIAGSGMAGFMLMNAAYMLPEQVSQIAEGIVGEPVLDVYTKMREAEQSGYEFSREELTEFILRANDALMNRGGTGKAFAAKLADQYAEEKATLVDIMKEVYDNRQQARIDVISREADKAKAQTPQFSHVNKLLKPQAEIRPEMGKFTGEYNKRISQAATITPGLQTPA